MGKLTALRIKSLTEPGKYSDGDGLMLFVRGSGVKNWVLRTQVQGRRRDIGLGSLKSVSLADAREAASGMRRQIAQGLDPIAERKRVELVIPTFQEAAELVHEEHKAAWKNGKHQAQWISTLETYAYGQQVKRPLSDMTLLKILRDFELNVTVHGFRSAFRDWVAEETSFPGEIAEAALAHTVLNKVEAAYRRTNYLEKRRELMRLWGAYCRGEI